MVALQLTCLIAEKEKKSSSYKEGKLDALSEEKIIKIKKFAKEYIAKVLRKLEKSGYRPKDASFPPTTTASAASETPNSNDHTVMSVEEAMDMDETSDHEGNKADDADMSDAEEPTHQTEDALPPEDEPDETLTMDPMDLLSSSHPQTACSDPRSRPPNGTRPIQCSSSDEDRDEIDFLGAPNLDPEWGWGASEASGVLTSTE
jgi:histone-lysine N-methyltransferase SETD2